VGDSYGAAINQQPSQQEGQSEPLMHSVPSISSGTCKQRHEGLLCGCMSMKCVTFISVFVALASVCGMIAAFEASKGESSSRCSGSSVPLPPQSIAYRVPLVMQTTDFWCGAASTASVLAAFAIPNVTQAELASEMTTSPGWGTDWSRIVNATVSRGLDVRVGQNMSVMDVQRELVERQALVIIDYVAWCGPPWSCESQYANDTVDGHYSVVIGFNASGMLLMDPYMLFGSGRESYGFVGYEGWSSRWHDIDSQWQNRVVRLGISVSRRSAHVDALSIPQVMAWPDERDVQYTR